MSYTNNFRDSGHPTAGMFASATGAGQVIAAPGAGKRIMIFDIMASAATSLKDGASGTDYIIYASPQATNLSAPIVLPDNKEVYSTAGNITIVYTII